MKTPPSPSSSNAALAHITVPMATAPMLLAVAIFSVTLLSQTTNASATITDELFALLSAVCLLGSATVADSAMDSCNASWVNRIKFLGFGYPLFCLAIGTLTTALPILYAEKAGATPIRSWRYILYAITGLTVAVKPMLDKENWWTLLMFACYIATIVVSAAH